MLTACKHCGKPAAKRKAGVRARDFLEAPAEQQNDVLSAWWRSARERFPRGPQRQVADELLGLFVSALSRERLQKRQESRN